MSMKGAVKPHLNWMAQIDSQKVIPTSIKSLQPEFLGGIPPGHQGFVTSNNRKNPPGQQVCADLIVRISAALPVDMLIPMGLALWNGLCLVMKTVPNQYARYKHLGSFRIKDTHRYNW
jgi:hypothetical protein